jgi:hypothetical protein
VSVSPSSLWTPALYELDDMPLPRGHVPRGTQPEVVVGTSPAHPSNRVDVQVRDGGGGPTRLLRTAHRAAAGRTPPGSLGPTQWFTAYLPTVGPARRLDYRLALSRAGQQLATLPSDGSWFSVESAPAPDRQPEAPAVTAPGQPRWAYDLSFFAALTVDLRAEVLGATPEGYRINFFVKDGNIRGPSIDAVVLPEGGDWMCIRPDGIGMVDISITYQTADQALILERAGGVFDLGPDGYAEVAAGRFSGSPPFYATPSWSTAHPNWQWLNRRQGFGVGRVVLDELQVRCDIYLPTVGDSLAGSRDSPG